jgi:exopolysaccharide biosynthesis WecB/TagA/CpsF family protein
VDFRIGEARVSVNVPDRAALLSAVGDRLARGEGFAIATLNLDHLAKLRGDAAFRAAYAAQDFVTADGNPVVWLSRIAGRPVALVTGSDLVVPLVRAAAAAGAPIGLIGSTAQSLAGAAAKLAAAVPGVAVVARIAPPMGFDADGPAAEAALRDLAAAGTRLCLVALGAPKQERFAALGRRLLPGMGFAAIGAGLDFLSGAQRRAPAWMRALALEWLWRMLCDPRRLARRYAASALILPGLVLQALAQRLR